MRMRVLVTGASGTVGTFICRRLVLLGHDVVAFSRNHSRQIENCSGCSHEVGDVEDYHEVLHAMKVHRVEGVIHAAANKHVVHCNDYPVSAVRSNVLGSLNVLRAIQETDSVRSTVMVSTDKACNHDQVYGMTKYLVERMAAEYAHCVTSWIRTVRFGNVFGSAGSVLPIWFAKFKAGEDVVVRTVNGESPTRLAMLPSEAAEFCTDMLFWNEGGSGSVYVPYRLPAVDIWVLAHAMKELLNSDSQIKTEPLHGSESVSETLVGQRETFAKLHFGRVWEVYESCGGQPPPPRPDVLLKGETKEFAWRALKETGYVD